MSHSERLLIIQFKITLSGRISAQICGAMRPQHANTAAQKRVWKVQVPSVCSDIPIKNWKLKKNLKPCKVVCHYGSNALHFDRDYDNKHGYIAHFSHALEAKIELKG